MSGRIVIVTGSAGGIGKCISDRFRADGDEVIGIDLADGLDISDPETCQQKTADIIAEHGRIDVLCNNAGTGAVGDVVESTPEDWNRVFQANVFGMAYLSQAVIPHMRERGDGAIVNTCSVAAVVGLLDRAVYSSSKGAVLALTLAMAADEASRGIRVNSVSPGTVDGPWVQRLINNSSDPDATATMLKGRQPLGRLVKPEEVAEAVAFLAHPATYTTGQNLVLDGGIQALRLVDKRH
jgi:NAD(P)-dependent dehydrogenase (short-subunit alcohol dehydrogenase family)